MEPQLDHNDIDSLSTFRELYDRQLKFEQDGTIAFDKATHNFRSEYGYNPYSRFEDFLVDLFKCNGGFQILNQSINYEIYSSGGYSINCSDLIFLFSEKEKERKNGTTDW